MRITAKPVLVRPFYQHLEVNARIGGLYQSITGPAEISAYSRAYQWKKCRHINPFSVTVRRSGFSLKQLDR